MLVIMAVDTQVFPVAAVLGVVVVVAVLVVDGQEDRKSTRLNSSH